MKKLFFILIIFIISYKYVDIHNDRTQNTQKNIPNKHKTVDNSLAEVDSATYDAFIKHKSNVQVSGKGVVIKLLPDDVSDSKHQKFIIKLSSGQTLLVAHNIDLAPRVSSVGMGDTIEFSGEYEWNEKGGVLHWTHKDPSGFHIAGWLKHKGKIYQ